jgi:hypothetical protein
MTLDGSGNLGIGTTTIGTRLVAAGTGQSLSGTAYNVADFTNAGQTLGTRIGYDSSNGAVIASSGVDKPIAFWQFSGAAYTERMRIDSSGQVIVGPFGGNGNAVVAGSSSIAGFTNQPGTNLLLKSGDGSGAGSSFMTFSTSPAGSSGSTVNTAVERMRIDNRGNALVGLTSVINGYVGLQSNAVMQTGGIYTNRGSFANTGGTTQTINVVTLANVEQNQTYLVTIRQGGSNGNWAFGFVLAYGAACSAKTMFQDNTNAVLLLNFTQSGLTVQCTVGSGFGATTWDWVLTRLA